VNGGSNASSNLGTQPESRAAPAGAGSLIDSDSGRVSYVGSDGSNRDGRIHRHEAMGRIWLGGGWQEMCSGEQALGQAFAAVYVEPGA